MTKAIIRIKGQVDITESVKETLNRLNLRRKYTCAVLPKERLPKGLLQKIRNYTAYGEIDDETLKTLIEKRAKTKPGKKIEISKVMEDLKKTGKSESIKPIFRLHPPLKGIKTKIHYPKGALGDHGKDINKLIKRML